jgi:hypothetical protein
MPKDDIDYSNTIIYKIYCNDKSINDVYVGHTTNFTKRKYQHKIACNNLDNKLKIYDTIRQNGGWDNWDMVEIAKYNCKDKTEARIKEQQYYEALNATLNSCPPCIDKKNYFCNICNLQCNTPKTYQTHMDSTLHKNKFIMEDNFTNKNSSDFMCKYCLFKCSKKSDWDRHILTQKHMNANKMLENANTFTYENTSEITFTCKNCNKVFIHSSSLSRHKKKCQQEDNQIDDKTEITHDLILNILQQNKELQQILIEQNKTIIELSKLVNIEK